MKRQLLSVVLIFAVCTVIDYLVHGVYLKDLYQATAQLWRPMAEMKQNMGLMYVSTVIVSLVFVIIYDRFFAKKSVSAGMLYGLLYGIASGTGMAVGSYACMPIPISMAAAWFVAVFVECLLAGLIVGFFLKPRVANI